MTFKPDVDVYFSKEAQEHEPDYVEFGIDKGIPMPEMTTTPGRRPLYPFQRMEVGDSFFVPDGSYDRLSSLCRYHNSNAKRMLEGCDRIEARGNSALAETVRGSFRGHDGSGRKYRAGNVPGGVRVWRIN